MINGHYGWICPKCERSCAPHLENCQCSPLLTAPTPPAAKPPPIPKVWAAELSGRGPAPDDKGFANSGEVSCKMAID